MSFNVPRFRERRESGGKGAKAGDKKLFITLPLNGQLPFVILDLYNVAHVLLPFTTENLNMHHENNKI